MLRCELTVFSERADRGNAKLNFIWSWIEKPLVKLRNWREMQFLGDFLVCIWVWVYELRSTKLGYLCPYLWTIQKSIKVRSISDQWWHILGEKETKATIDHLKIYMSRTTDVQMKVFFHRNHIFWGVLWISSKPWFVLARCADVNAACMSSEWKLSENLDMMIN